MQEVFIVAACRTPIGKMGGALKSMTVADLSAHVFQEIVKRGNITPDMVDEIIMGETRPSSAIHNVARHAALLAGFPYEVTALTIQQACSSGMAAIQNAANKIMVGMADIMIAGGVESIYRRNPPRQHILHYPESLRSGGYGWLRCLYSAHYSIYEYAYLRQQNAP